MSNKVLRESLDVDDFSGREQLAAKALKDGKSVAARDCVRDWLARQRVYWDGKSDIGEAIVQALAEANELRRARTRLRLIELKLKNPHIAGREAVQESLKIIQAMEGASNGKFQSSGDCGSAGT